MKDKNLKIEEFEILRDREITKFKINKPRTNKQSEFGINNFENKDVKQNFKNKDLKTNDDL